MNTTKDVDDEQNERDILRGRNDDNENLCRPSSNVDAIVFDAAAADEQTTKQRRRPRFHLFYGVFFAFISTFFTSLSSVLIKKAQLFTGPEQTFIRLLVQFIIMFSIASCLGLNILGPSKDRKLLHYRGLLGMIGITANHIAIKFINPADVVSIFHVNVMLVAIFARFTLNEKCNLLQIVCIFMAIAGFYFRSFQVLKFKKFGI